MFSGGNNILCTIFVEVHHVKRADFIPRGHVFLYVCHFGQVACAVVKCLDVWAYALTECFDEILGKLSELA